MSFPAAIPEVAVSDFAAALAYYRDRLGFTVDWSNEDLGLAGLSQGGARLFIGAAHYRVHLETGGRSVIWLDCSGRAEVDLLHGRWKAAGARVDAPMLNEPWSLYEFLAYDPDGNIIRAYHFILDAADD